VQAVRFGGLKSVPFGLLVHQRPTRPNAAGANDQGVRSPSELNAPAGQWRQNAAPRVFFNTKIGVFCVLFGGLYQAAYASQSRTESSPGALRSFCGSRCEAPTTRSCAQRCISAACAAFRACHQLRLLLLLALYCRLHELGNTQQEAGTREQEVDTAAAGENQITPTPPPHPP
jgi:hypothetical protein